VELMQFYGILMLIENTWGNGSGNFRNHLKLVQAEFGHVHGLGIDCFEYLYQSFEPSIEELVAIVDCLHNAFQRFVLLMFCIEIKFSYLMSSILSPKLSN
jgi:hypothetical protein